MADHARTALDVAEASDRSQERHRRAEPAAVAALFPARDERERSEDLLTHSLLAAGARIPSGSVTPSLDLAAFRRELASFDFSDGQPIDALVAWAIEQLEHGIVHVTHPRYFGLFNPAPTFPAQCADRIVAAFNPQLATSTTSPVAVAIEAHVIAAIAQRAGLPTATVGHFTTGGAEANYTAAICALTRAHAEFATKGARAFAGPPVFYVSRESHLAWFKIAHQSGVGREAVRLIETDGSGRLEPASLAKAIEADRAGGRIPVMIAATAGTTNAGMIDPLAACAAIAGEKGLWYHVDAAWGGAMIASDRLRSTLAGIERADSVTIDGHKWFATTMGCGMFLTPHADVLSNAFQVSTGYMPSNIGGVDPYVTSVQWSRRFLGLRLFLSLAAAGWSGYARHVERSVDLAAMLKEALVERGWSISNRSSLAVLCIEPPRGSAEIKAIVDRVVASRRAWVSVADFEGRPVIRACVTHGESTLNDVMALVQALDKARQLRYDALN
jgi:aromatic-L-amino-acid/L-tryptophan decarboxylase